MCGVGLSPGGPGHVAADLGRPSSPAVRPAGSCQERRKSRSAAGSLVIRRSQVIDSGLERTVAGHAFPQRVGEIDWVIRGRLAAGDYEGLDGAALCAAATAYLQEVCPARCLRLLRQDGPRSLEPGDDDAGRAALLALMRAENQGVRRFDRLAGTSGTSMPGGWRSMTATTLPPTIVSPRQPWTGAQVPAPRYLDRLVYVLTSARTFLGGEDVADTLQDLGGPWWSVRRGGAGRGAPPHRPASGDGAHHRDGSGGPNGQCRDGHQRRGAAGTGIVPLWAQPGRAVVGAGESCRCGWRRIVPLRRRRARCGVWGGYVGGRAGEGAA